MKEEIRKEVMKIFNQEDDVDNVVDNILRLFDVSGRSEQLIFDCPEPKWHNGDITRYGVCTFCDNKKLIKN